MYYPIEKMCKVLKINRSGYYAWRGRKPSNRAQVNKAISKEIYSIYEGSYRIYGSPRIHEELKRKGMPISRIRVARLMKNMGLRSEIKLKYKPSTTDSKHSFPIAPNLLDRQFSVKAPNVAWVSDLTYIRTLEGWLYLTVVIDLYDRKVIGWALSKTMQASETTMAALDMALLNRKPKAGLIFHSDRGSQYACFDFRALLEQHRIRPSMSRKGNCWDNAVAESFFKTLKVECVYRAKYLTIEQAKKDVFTYIEAWYNIRRRHSALNYATPAEMEFLFYNQHRA